MLLDELDAKPAPLHADPDGTVRVDGTRVTLDTVIGAFNDGNAAEEIAWAYPSLRLQDVYAIITYYLWHRSAVDAYLARRHEEAEELQRRHEQLFPSTELRERLLARRALMHSNDAALPHG